YFNLELSSPDFQHNVYPELLTKQAYSNSITIGKAISSATPTNVDITPLNPPYTPKLKSFTVNYTASFEIDINTYTTNHEDSLFHINVFGYSTPTIQTTASTNIAVNWVYFLPQFENEGELYI